MRDFFDTSVRRRQLAQLQAWIAGADDPAPPDRHVARAELWQRIDAEGRSSAERAMGRQHTNGRSWPRTGAFMARGIAIVGLVCALIVVLFRNPSRQTKLEESRTYATAIGQRITLQLTDGSRVTLAPQTTLRVPRDFGAQTRTLDLTGEAYFDVTDASRAPFVVRAGHVDARVLGTTFAVRHYASDAQVHIAVTTGKIGVFSRTLQTALGTITAGHVGHMTDSTGTLVMTEDATRYTEWRAGRLVFHMAPLQDVLETLGRWYGYQFKLADTTLAHRHVTTSVDDRSSAEALGVLKLILDVDMTVDGNVITLHERRAAGTPAHGRRAVSDSFSTQTEAGR